MAHVTIDFIYRPLDLKTFFFVYDVIHNNLTTKNTKYTKVIFSFEF